jgi:hypothetical protein
MAQRESPNAIASGLNGLPSYVLIVGPHFAAKDRFFIILKNGTIFCPLFLACFSCEERVD